MDRNRHMATHTISSAPGAVSPRGHISQEDERLRRARLAYADAAVNKTARRLTLDLPFDERYQAARDNEDALLARAELRTRYGIATFTDQRIIATRDARAALAVTR
jgi:hypothetical protein